MKRLKDFDELLNTSNFNYNRLVAIDTIATSEDEIIELCIYPMNAQFQLVKTIIPLYINVKPKLNPWKFESEDYKRLGISEMSYLSAWNDGLPPSVATELFERWCDHKIQLLPGRRLMPLTYDWGSKKAQLIKLFGEKHFEYYFHFHSRDILAVSLFANDFANVSVERPPYPKVDMAYIFSQTRTEYNRKDTIINCVGIAKIYNKMLSNFFVSHCQTGKYLK